MDNSVNYLNHTLVQPDEVHQRFDLIPPFKTNIDSKGNSFKERALHITQLALPLLCLYQPLGRPVALITGGQRVITHFSFALFAIKDGKFKESGKQMFHMSIAVFMVASSYFEFKIGLFLINIHDATVGVHHAVNYLAEGKYSDAAKESLQVMASLLYLSFMMTGTLEYLLAMYVIQAAISLYQCRDEIAGKRFPEALLCFAMALVRLNQANTCYEQIQARNVLLSFQKAQQLFNRAMKGKEVREIFTNELNDLEGNIDQKRVVYKDAKGVEYDLGSHFHEFGKELVKGGNLELRKITVNGEVLYELDFKVNQVFRKEIQSVIEDYKQMDQKQISEVLQAVHSKASAITVTDEKYILGKLKLGNAHRVSVKGLGNVVIGSTDKYPGLQHRIVVQMDSTKNLYDMHELLSLTGLEKAIQHSSTTDIERMKIGHLYRVFFPREATPFERSEEFFSLPIDQLKTKIVSQNPEMKPVMERYLDNMEKAEILPGKVRYNISGLAEELRQNGVTSLTAAITGAYTDKDLMTRVVTILQMGMTSNETRASHGIGTPGMSPKDDFKANSADSVFTQVVTKGHERYGFSSYYYSSDVRVMIKPEIMERGTYQYEYDSFGTRNPEWGLYENRLGVLEFARNQTQLPTFGNEVMIKDRIDPSFISGFVVRDEAFKRNMIVQLRSANLTKTSNGVEMINDVPIDTFIRTEDRISEWKQTVFKA